MTDFVSNLIKKLKKPALQKDSTVSIKPDSKNLVSPDSILVNEHVKINVYSLKEVKVDKDGDITGNIHSKSCVVNGKVNGNILSMEYIEVKNTAIIEGNIKSASIQIEAGSVINGFVSIEKKIKLPAIITQMADAISDKPENKAAGSEEVYVTVRNSSANISEAPEIKGGEPEVIPEILENKVEAPEIKAREPESIPVPQTDKIIAQSSKKTEVIIENPLKKTPTESSNDSWW